MKKNSEEKNLECECCGCNVTLECSKSIHCSFTDTTTYSCYSCYYAPPTYEETRDYINCDRCRSEVDHADCPESGFTCRNCWEKLENEF